MPVPLRIAWVVAALTTLLAAAPLRAQPAEPAPAQPSEEADQDRPRQGAPDAGEAPPAGPADDGAEAIEVQVLGRPPLLLDPSHDVSRVSGERLRTGSRFGVLDELSQQAADVYVSSRGLVHGIGPGASGGINVRGLGGSPNTQVRVIEDGVPDAQGIFGHPIPDAYVPSLIDEVLVVKGGDSVLYGSNALGGAIVVRNRWRRHPGFELYNDAAYGSFDTVRETAAFLGRFHDWDAAAALHVLQTEGHRAGAGGSTVVGHGAARYRLAPELHLTLRHKLARLEGADPGPATHPHPDHTYEVWRDQASLALELRRGVARVTVRPFLNLGIHQLYDGFWSRDHTAGTQAEATLGLSRSVQLLLGLGAEQVGGRVENRISGERTDGQAASQLYNYQQVTVRPFEALSLVFGTRNVHDTQFGPELAYKAGARWRIYRGLYLRSRVARNFRRPTLRELYLPFPTANPELRPERSLNADVGMGWGSEHLDLGATGYRTEADDLIKYFGAWPSAEVVNVDHVVFYGIEGRVGVKRLGPVSLFVTGDWRDVGRYTRQNPTAKLDATVDVQHDFGVHGISASVTGEWVHGLYMANYEREPLDDVFFLDLTLSYQRRFPDQGLSAEPYVLARNLLDRPGELVAGYPLPGFHLLGGLRLGFEGG